MLRTRLRGTGVILLRLEGLAPSVATRRIDTALARHGPRLEGHLMVIDHRRDRLRRLGPSAGAP